MTRILFLATLIAASQFCDHRGDGGSGQERLCPRPMALPRRPTTRGAIVEV
jgi:hypothetical protein